VLNTATLNPQNQFTFPYGNLLISSATADGKAQLFVSCKLKDIDGKLYNFLLQFAKLNDFLIVYMEE